MVAIKNWQNIVNNDLSTVTGGIKNHLVKIVQFIAIIKSSEKK